MSEIEKELTPREVIENIRLEEYFLDDESSAETQRRVKSLHRKLDKALQILARDLYQKETHFVLELVQNADDNQYDPGTEPRLAIRLVRDRLVVSNNEVGFSEKNVRALCSVGESTKLKREGYIGEKGIGFKSVFTVSDAPEIHSNGYHFRFDHTGKNHLLGYVVPNWCERSDTVAGGDTTIVLPARAGVVFDDSLLKDVDAKLLLFLKKLRKLEIASAAGIKVFTRDDRDGLTVLRSELGISPGEALRAEQRYVCTSHSLSMGDLKEDTRESIETTQMVLAFPVDDTGRARPEAGCATFAFLPIRSFGFKFCIQGDFLLSANREDIHSDRPWNLRLRDSIAPLFAASLSAFQATPELFFSYLRYLPTESEVTDAFFRPVVQQMRRELGKKRCLLGATGEMQKPAQIRLVSDEFRELIPPKDAIRLFCQDYPDRRLDADDATLVWLGCHRQTMADVVAIFDRHSAWLQAKDKDWLARFYAYLAVRSLTKVDDEVLKRSPCLPKAGGGFAIPEREPVFFPLASRRRYGFEHELSVLDEEVLEKATALSDKVRGFFERLGARSADAFELITNHILPLHAGEAWQRSDRKALIGHVRYIKDKLQQYREGADKRAMGADQAMAQLCEGLWIATKKKETAWTYWHGTNLYLSKEYRPVFPLETMLGESLEPSRLVSADYLPIRKKDADARQVEEETASWRDFMMQLGVTDCPRVEEDGRCSPELESLLESQDSAVRRATLECIDRNWSRYAPRISFPRRVGRSVMNADSQFVTMLRTTLAPMARGKKAMPLSNSYYRSKELEEVFGDKLSYVEATFADPSFLAACRITLRADADACIKRLRQCKDEKTGQRRTVERVYRRLEALWERDRDNIKAAFAVEELIYFKGKDAHPRWLNAEDVVWKGSGPFLDALYPPLGEQYRDFHSFFVQKVGVQAALPTGKMVAALASLDQVEQLEERTQVALRIYRRANLDLSGRFGQSPGAEPDWLDVLRAEAVFLDRKGRLVERDEVYVDDVPARAALFEDAQDVSLLAVPFEDVPRLRPLFDVVELRYLSEELTETVESELGGERDPTLTSVVRASVPFLERLVYNRFPRQYDAAREAGAFKRLTRLSVEVVPELRFRVTLGTHAVVTPGDIYTDGDRLLLRQEAGPDVDLIAEEICRLLDVPVDLADAVARLLQASPEEAEHYLRRKNVGRLPDEEEPEPDGDGVESEPDDREPVEPTSRYSSEGSGEPTLGESHAEPVAPGVARQPAEPPRGDVPSRDPAEDSGEARGAPITAKRDTAPEVPIVEPRQPTTPSRHPNGGAASPIRRRQRAATAKSGRLLSYADVATGEGRRDEGVGDERGAAVRSEVEQSAVSWFLATQGTRWRSLEEMPHNNPGFDIRAVALDGGQEEIEVKGQSGAWTEAGVALTPRELMRAEGMRKRYWLCVVEYATDESRRRLYLVNDPFGNTQQFRIDSGWKSIAAVEAKQPLRPAAGMRVGISNEGSGVIISAKRHGQFFKLHIQLDDGGQRFRTFNPTTMTLSEAS